MKGTRNKIKLEECHCTRTSRYHTQDSCYEHHTVDRCWTDKKMFIPTQIWIDRLVKLANELEELVDSKTSDPTEVSAKFKYLIGYINSAKQYERIK